MDRFRIRLVNLMAKCFNARFYFGTPKQAKIKSAVRVNEIRRGEDVSWTDTNRDTKSLNSERVALVVIEKTTCKRPTSIYKHN